MNPETEFEKQLASLKPVRLSSRVEESIIQQLREHDFSSQNEDAELLELEAQLKSLVPSAGTSDHIDRIAQELEESTGNVIYLRFWPAALSTLAASVVLVLSLYVWNRPSASRPELQPDYFAATDSPAVEVLADVPAGKSNLLAAASTSVDPVMYEDIADQELIDAGIVLIDDNVPVHKFRRQYLRHNYWYDAQKDVAVETVSPWEEVLFVRMDTR